MDLPLFLVARYEVCVLDHPGCDRWVELRPRGGVWYPGELLRGTLRHARALLWSLLGLPARRDLRGRPGADNRHRLVRGDGRAGFNRGLRRRPVPIADRVRLPGG